VYDEKLTDISGGEGGEEEYPKAGINLKLTVRSKISDLYWGISDFKTSYQARINVVKDKRGDLTTDSYGILARCRKLFSRLLNIR